MHYYIDGYNLLFRILHADDDLAARRQQMVEALSAKMQLLGIDATLVFDSQYQQGRSTRTHVQGLEILFTDYGETADERILDEIKAEKHITRITVVTSDKKLAWFARRCSAATESVETFVAWLEKRYKNKLRHRQQPEKEVQVLPQRAPSPLPKKPKLPSIETTAEHCFAYYLETFQAELQKLAESTPSKTSLTPKRKLKHQKPVEAPSDPILDMDRWLQIFERKLKKDDDFSA